MNSDAQHNHDNDTRRQLVVQDAKKTPRAYADLVYQTAFAGNKENGADEAERGRQVKRRATG